MQKAADVVREETRVTCDDCFFRRAALCAIRGNTPCPTFRRADDGRSAARLGTPRGEPGARRVPTAA